MFNLHEGAELVNLARHAIETLMFNMPLSLEHYKKFSQKLGVYVTLKKDGKLRGQMGLLETNDDLYHAVIKAARDAAFKDRRFEQLKKEELSLIEIEVTVVLGSRLLRAKSPEEYASQIQVGHDGVAIKSGIYNDVLLPDEKMMYGWDAERLLRYLSTSAGMTMDAWKTMNHNIYVFQCQTFAERNGKIIEMV